MRIFKQYKYSANDFSKGKTPYVQQGVQFFGIAAPPVSIELVDSTKDKLLVKDFENYTINSDEIKNPWWIEKREFDNCNTVVCGKLLKSSFSPKRILEGENLEDILPTISASNKTIIVDSLEEI